MIAIRVFAPSDGVKRQVSVGRPPERQYDSQPQERHNTRELSVHFEPPSLKKKKTKQIDFSIALDVFTALRSLNPVRQPQGSAFFQSKPTASAQIRRRPPSQRVEKPLSEQRSSKIPNGSWRYSQLLLKLSQPDESGDDHTPMAELVKKMGLRKVGPQSGNPLMYSDRA
jgi:hypothetical protein